MITGRGPGPCDCREGSLAILAEPRWERGPMGRESGIRRAGDHSDLVARRIGSAPRKTRADMAIIVSHVIN